MRKNFRFIATSLLLIVFSCGKDDDPVPNAIPVINAQTVNVSEAALDTDDLLTVTATDADGDDLLFSIRTNDNNLFEITTSGVLSLAQGQSLDYETSTNHTITISVTDGEASAAADITINVIDVDENTAPQISDQTLDVAENSAIGFVVGTIMATDAENDNLTFSTPSTSPEFNISAQGEITVAAELNFEVVDTYKLDVIVNDGILDASALLTITVSDANDAPTIPVFDETFTVAENITDTEVIGNLQASDEDGDILVYSIVQNATGANGGDLFEIDTNTGDISLDSGQSLDFETSTAHTITIGVSDGQTQRTPTATINVTDVDENAPRITVIAGEGNSDFTISTGIAIDANGDLLVAVNGNNAVRKVTPSGEVTTLNLSGIDQPWGIAIDNNGAIYVGNSGRGSQIDKHTPNGSGSFDRTTLVGGSSNDFADGTGTDALFNRPHGMTFDSNGNLYVADQRNHAIRKITPAGVVTTLAGMGGTFGSVDGTGTAASFNRPYDIAVDSNGNFYVADFSNHSIRKITASGIVTTFIGGTDGNVDGIGNAAQISRPVGICIDSNDNMYISEFQGRIKKIEIATAEVTSITQISTGSNGLNNLEINAAGTELYVTQPNSISKIELNNDTGSGVN